MMYGPKVNAPCALNEQCRAYATNLDERSFSTCAHTGCPELARLSRDDEWRRAQALKAGIRLIEKEQQQMRADKKLELTGLIAIGLRLAYAASGQRPMDAAAVACDQAEALVAELERRKMLPDIG